MSLTEVNWSTLPVPEDDGKAKHLLGARLPDVFLPSTDGNVINVTGTRGVGLKILFCFPMMGDPAQALPDGWDMIPGARGCTPQACFFRDFHQELIRAGADNVFGISTQDQEFQSEAVERLHLPYPLLSDEQLFFARALDLPTFEVEGTTMIKRITLILKGNVVRHVFYPIFPPHEHPQQVLNYLRAKNESNVRT